MCIILQFMKIFNLCLFGHCHIYTKKTHLILVYQFYDLNCQCVTMCYRKQINRALPRSYLVVNMLMGYKPT
jgi:hypothetical protein